MTAPKFQTVSTAPRTKMTVQTALEADVSVAWVWARPPMEVKPRNQLTDDLQEEEHLLQLPVSSAMSSKLCFSANPLHICTRAKYSTYAAVSHYIGDPLRIPSGST